jgi:hypothetical protein
VPRRGILKKSNQSDPKKRLSACSTGSNSSADILDFSYDSGDENYPMLSKCPQMSREGSLVGTPSFEDMNNEGELLNTLIPSNTLELLLLLLSILFSVNENLCFGSVGDRSVEFKNVVCNNSCSNSDNNNSGDDSKKVFDSEKKPARGILKRKGKFSGGDSGCILNESGAKSPGSDTKEILLSVPPLSSCKMS